MVILLVGAASILENDPFVDLPPDESRMGSGEKPTVGTAPNDSVEFAKTRNQPHQDLRMHASVGWQAWLTRRPRERRSRR